MIYKNYSLKTHNTFGFDVSADYYTEAGTTGELREALEESARWAIPFLILGGGSNTLFCNDYRGMIIRPCLKGIEKINENNDFVYLKVGAGEVWDNFVAFAIANNFGGVENLSFIPGHVGASPVQNIGAYGVEAKDCIHEVECLLPATGEIKVFANADCRFGYRESIFKHEWRNKAIVVSVTFRLHKKPQLCTHYGNIEEELKNYQTITLATVRQAVIAIRNRKIPDPAELGNAGSFFKNPMVAKAIADAVVAHDPQMSVYPVDEERVKLPAGRLIELAGWKGKRVGNVGVHDKQALVLVNYGGGTGHAILALAEAIQQSVFEQFGVRLEMEVNVVK